MKILLILISLSLLAGIPANMFADSDCAVEWINKCQEYCGNEDLGGRDDCALGFYNKMTGAPLNYTGRFSWGDFNAWEKDFKDQELVGTGDDHDWIDKVDIAYHADHGGPGRFCFGSLHDDCRLWYDEGKWGDDYDLEWLVLDDCSCLAHSTWTDWISCFAGLHMILSFDTGAHDSGSRGQKFAEKLSDGWTVKQAWWYACEQTEGSGCYAAIVGACNMDAVNYNEHVWKAGWVASDPIPIGWWWWTHHQC